MAVWRAAYVASVLVPCRSTQIRKETLLDLIRSRSLDHETNITLGERGVLYFQNDIFLGLGWYRCLFFWIILDLDSWRSSIEGFELELCYFKHLNTTTYTSEIGWCPVESLPSKCGCQAVAVKFDIVAAGRRLAIDGSFRWYWLLSLCCQLLVHDAASG